MPPSTTTRTEDDLKRIAESFGELKGELRVMHQSTLKALDNIRDDMRRMEDNHRHQMETMEDRMNTKIDGVSGRVKSLEEKSQNQAITTAKQGVVTGGIASAVVYGFIELLKRIPH